MRNARHPHLRPYSPPPTMRARILSLAIALVTLSFAAACAGDAKSGARKDAATSQSSGSIDLNGAGATFPYPIYSRWFSEYAAKTGVKINYQSIGSGGGIKQLSENTVDFGASDGPMSDDEMSKAKGGKVLHFPTVLGAGVIIYNLAELQQPLRLTGEIIADIFLARITRWNDARIAAVNSGVSLPAKDILVVHRTDGSGTTYIFTDFLSSVSPAWRDGPGKGKDVKWRVGLGGKGNEGVAGTVKQTPGAIGYVELAYAKQNRLPTAFVRNASGAFVEPSTASITAAAEGAAAKMGPESDYRVSIVNAPGAATYPISSFTWLLVYESQRDATKGKKLVDFMKWMYIEGQGEAASLDYAPLPAAMATALTKRLTSIQMGSRP